MFEAKKKQKLENAIKKNEKQLQKIKEELDMGKLIIKNGKLVREEDARQAPLPQEQDEVEQYFPPQHGGYAPQQPDYGANRQPLPPQGYDYDVSQQIPPQMPPQQQIPPQMPPQQPLPPREYAPQFQAPEPGDAPCLIIVKFSDGESLQMNVEGNKRDTILNNLAEACENQGTIQLGKVFINGRNILFFTYQ